MDLSYVDSHAQSPNIRLTLHIAVKTFCVCVKFFRGAVIIGQVDPWSWATYASRRMLDAGETEVAYYCSSIPSD